MGKSSAFLPLVVVFFLLVAVPVLADDQEIRIASVFALSGAASASNLHQVQGVRYAVEELNSAGGLLGKKIKLIEIDNGSSAILSRLAAEKAVDQRVHAVIGASWSDHSMAMAPVLQNAGIPMITPNSTNPAITRIGDYIFRVCFTDTLQGQVLARFALEKLGAETAVIVQCIACIYSMDLSAFFSEAFTRGKGRVLNTLDYKRGQSDAEFHEILKKIGEDIPDLIFISGHNESARMIKQAQNLGLGSAFLGGDGWGAWNFWAVGGHEIRSGYFASHWSPEIGREKVREFMDRFQRFYYVNENAALAYDATMLLADAIERAGSLQKKKIRNALAATSGFEGVTGIITMDENGDPEKKAVVIMKIRQGKASLHSVMEE
ncbi:amino acid/amide ABC transporter substrate-binding protein (HAAT family) [Desulfobotulus alkaliphilus]|uniref:Amino acid/amide ABC transporter substrate-binding protein (HAAT family) n=1 Tax=Desulfobotulus alkaliphilus TaxID=622671 RepID=A0A562RN54_9BACT|nr:ABC transporter substrate-binding protein [Desulfobotulus alkaliphilus]TWI70313.1 amino acid/amide ABC transporter substrate-binding protein (HAAT family) [Desulfobotulus alkaliphilus]